MTEARGAEPYATAYHAPVLCDRVLELLITDAAGTYVDATAGGGGHTAALLEALHATGRAIAIDRDSDAIAAIRSRLAPALARGRLVLIRGVFGTLPALIESYAPVSGLLLDLGVSSHQLDHAPRGFSHRCAGPLDMRMDTCDSHTAHAIVHAYSERAIRRILFRWGEEPRARRIARAIVAARPLDTTADLADVIRSVVPTRFEARTLARTFQALRIAVNGELDELSRVLEASEDVVTDGGRLVVISYHSLEDRLVKRMMRDGNLAGEPERDFYGVKRLPWKPLTHKPIMPGAPEIALNPRARSARLRAAVRQVMPGHVTG